MKPIPEHVLGRVRARANRLRVAQYRRLQESRSAARPPRLGEACSKDWHFELDKGISYI